MLTEQFSVFDTDPDHHHEHRDEDVQHLWDEWSEHGVYVCSWLKLLP